MQAKSEFRGALRTPFDTPSIGRKPHVQAKISGVSSISRWVSSTALLPRVTAGLRRGPAESRIWNPRPRRQSDRVQPSARATRPVARPAARSSKDALGHPWTPLGRLKASSQAKICAGVRSGHPWTPPFQRCKPCIQAKSWRCARESVGCPPQDCWLRVTAGLRRGADAREPESRAEETGANRVQPSARPWTRCRRTDRRSRAPEDTP